MRAAREPRRDEERHRLRALRHPPRRGQHLVRHQGFGRPHRSGRHGRVSSHDERHLRALPSDLQRAGRRGLVPASPERNVHRRHARLPGHRRRSTRLPTRRSCHGWRGRSRRRRSELRGPERPGQRTRRSSNGGDRTSCKRRPGGPIPTAPEAKSAPVRASAPPPARATRTAEWVHTACSMRAETAAFRRRAAAFRAAVSTPDRTRARSQETRMTTLPRARFVSM